jgi:hypothetical protein
MQRARSPYAIRADSTLIFPDFGGKISFFLRKMRRHLGMFGVFC